VVEGVGHNTVELLSNLGELAVSDRRDEQIAQRLAVKLHLSENIEHLPAEGGARLFELPKQRLIHIALAGLLSY